MNNTFTKSCLGLLAAVMLLASVGAVHAFDRQTMVTLTNVGFDGYVIKSDASNANTGYDRDQIHVEAVYQLFNDKASATTQPVRGMAFLFASANEVTPLASAGITNVVTVAGSSSVRVTNLLHLSGTDIVAGNPYYIRFDMSDSNSAGWGASPDLTKLLSLGKVHHFTNTVSSDAGVNVFAEMLSLRFEGGTLIASSTNRNDYKAQVDFELRRYDRFSEIPPPGGVPPKDDVSVVVNYRLLTDTGVEVPLVSSQQQYTVSMPAYAYQASAVPPVKPALEPFTKLLNLSPKSPTAIVQGKSYKLEATISHYETGTFLRKANTLTSSLAPLFYLTGSLTFGNVPTSLIAAGQLVDTVAQADGSIRASIAVQNAPIQGLPNHSVVPGMMSISFNAAGAATFVSSAVPVIVKQPAEDFIDKGQVRVQRVGPIRLDTTGAKGSLAVELPAGFGVTENRDTKVMKALLPFNDMPLTPTLEPVVTQLEYLPPNGAWASEETKPLWVKVQSIAWNTASGTLAVVSASSANLEYVRKKELDRLDKLAGALSNPGQNTKRSNEQYYRQVTGLVPGSFSVSVDAQTKGAQVNMSLTFAKPATGEFKSFRTHFPYDSEIKWNGTGSVQIVSDRIQTGKLFGVQSVSLAYTRNCPSGDCATNSPAAAATFTMSPLGGALSFLPHGGLAASGTLSQASNIEWGRISDLNEFSQRALAFSGTYFLMSGHFLSGADAGTKKDDGAAKILLSGVNSANLQPDLPGAARYQTGDGHNPGMNFTVPTDAQHQGRSVLAGNKTIPPYALAKRSKYYVRPGGVSGIHQAMPNAFNPGKLYGYAMTFKYFGLSYLDSVNIDSRTDGNVAVPKPSDFDLDFERLKVTCRGGLSDARVAQSNGDKILDYWSADFTPLSMTFRTKTGAECSSSDGFLTLGVGAYASHIPQVFYGALGFKTNGELITAASGEVADISSRLSGPNSVTFQGPAEETYRLTPVSGLYYSDYAKRDANSGETVGFVNLAGRLDVSFFEDMPVHLQTRGTKASAVASIHLMGGWPDRGWVEGAQHFFNDSAFDKANVGSPLNALLAYRAQDTDAYLPRAKKNLLVIVKVDYGMKWSSLERSFTSDNKTNDFFVLRTQHQVPYLSAANAEMTFGAQYDGLQRLSLASLSHFAVGGKALKPLRDVVDQGKKELDKLVTDQLETLMDDVLDRALDPLVDQVYDGLKDKYDTVAAGRKNVMVPLTEWRTNYNAIMNCKIRGTEPGCNDKSVVGILSNISGTIDDGLGFLHKIDGILEKGITVCDAFTSTFRDPDGNILSPVNGMFVLTDDGQFQLGLVRTLVERLVQDQNLQVGASYLAGVIDTYLQPLLQDATPTFKKIAETMLKVKTQLVKCRGYLEEGGEIAKNIKGKIDKASNEIQSMANDIDGYVAKGFEKMDSVGSPFENYGEEHIKKLIKTEIKDAFYGSRLSASIQQILRQYFADLTEGLYTLIDGVFAKLNEIVQKLIGDILADFDKDVLPFLEDLKKYAGFGKLEGYAKFNGDALRYARMDADFTLKVPKELIIRGYLEIKQAQSSGSAGSCYSGNANINEVTLGALGVPMRFSGERIRADIRAKFTFDYDEVKEDLNLRGLGGSFEMVEGKISFEAFEIYDFAASLMFGLDENYLAARAGVRFQNYQLAGGLFLGRTCTIEPLMMVDKDVAAVLGQPPFTGGYAYGEGWIPIYNAGCVFNITAGVGAGAFYFEEGPTFGGKMLAGASGEALCLVMVRGEIVLVGAKSGSDFNFRGRGTLQGSVGRCKWLCLKFKKSVSATYSNKKWTVEY